jgi:hypothetical protein
MASPSTAQLINRAMTTPQPLQLRPGLAERVGGGLSARQKRPYGAR